MTHIEDLSTEPAPFDDQFHQDISDLLPRIRPYSEDLYEKEYFLEKRWLQVDEVTHVVRLHIFRNEGEYLESIDGNILTGGWSILENSNTFILEKPSRSGATERTLYDLAFLNDDFFILKKHGSRNLGEAQFILMGREPLVDQLEWPEVLSLIETRFKNNLKLGRAIIIVIALLILYFLFSQI